MDNRKEVFRCAIKKTYDQWQSLKIALSYSNIAVNDFTNWLVDSTETFFYENDNLDSDEVAEWLDTILDQELDVRVEDQSVEQVCSKLCTYFNLVTQGDFEKVAELLNAPAPPPAPVACNSSQNDSDYDSSD